MFTGALDWTSAGLALSAFLITYQISSWVRTHAKRRGLHKPPGPKGYPVVGALGKLPKQEGWKVYNEWRQEHGDMIYLEVLGKKFLVLNSASLINDLLSTRANIYSDRIWSPMAQIAGNSHSMLLLNYGQEWRDQRKAFRHILGPGHINQLHPIIKEELVPFLRNLVEKPEDYRQSLRMYLGAIILRFTYGGSDLNYNRGLMDISEKIIAEFADIFAPGRMLVSVLPILRFVPSWFPGAGWKRRLENYSKVRDEVARNPLQDAATRLGNGTQKGISMASMLLQDLPEEDNPNYQYQYNIVKDATSITYLAGADTTFSSALALFLALAMHPAVQRNAQKQIDEVVGPHTLVRFEDVAGLPYLQAIVKEVGRWHTTSPLAFPHVLREDDSYNGFFIPAKTAVLANTWAVMHDHKNFDRPMEFVPERYLHADGTLNTSVMGPEDGLFGYGRRICPGRHLSNETLTYTAANLLACFDIKPGKDKQGNRVNLELKPTSGLVSTPTDFPLEITPRSDAHVAMLARL